MTSNVLIDFMNLHELDYFVISYGVIQLTKIMVISMVHGKEMKLEDVHGFLVVNLQTDFYKKII